MKEDNEKKLGGKAHLGMFGSDIRSITVWNLVYNMIHVFLFVPF
jgi:hypothetical protein